MDTYNSFDCIRKLYPILITDKERYVFKSCEYEWVTILERTILTRTNEYRDRVVNKDTAIFRGNQFRVVAIINKFDPKITTDRIMNSMYAFRRLEYIVGEIVEAKDYDDNINKIYSGGIYFYTTLEPAFSLELHQCDVMTGIISYYYDNGTMMSEYTFSNGKIIVRKQWHYTGKIFDKVIVGKNGSYRMWDIFGKIIIEKLNNVSYDEFIDNGIIDKQWIKYSLE